MKNMHLAIFCAVFFTNELSSAAVKEVAFLRDNRILVVAVDGAPVAELTADARPKGMLRWLPDGEHLSYMVRDENGAKARIVVVDRKGTNLRELAIRPVTDPPTEGMRFVENVSWISERKLRVMGSANPRNCEMFDFDLDTGKESNWQLGACGSFTPSPDGRHTAYLGLLAMTSDEDRSDSVEIDGGKIVHGGGAQKVRVVTGPVWSEDSKNVAFIEQPIPSGEPTVSVLSLAGQYDKVPVSKEVLTDPSLIWVGAEIVVGTGTKAMVVDRSQKRALKPAAETFERIQRTQQVALDSEQQMREARQRVEILVRKLGGRDGVGWPQ